MPLPRTKQRFLVLSTLAAQTEKANRAYTTRHALVHCQHQPECSSAVYRSRQRRPVSHDDMVSLRFKKLVDVKLGIPASTSKVGRFCVAEGTGGRRDVKGALRLRLVLRRRKKPPCRTSSS